MTWTRTVGWLTVLCLCSGAALGQIKPGTDRESDAKNAVKRAHTPDSSSTPSAVVKTPAKPAPPPAGDQPEQTPPNDDCANAASISVGSIAFSNVGATTDGPDNCGGMGSDIWYNFTATCTATLQVSTCGSGYDTVLSAYDGCGCPVGALLACNDDSCGLQSNIAFAVTTGQCYKIQLGGFVAAQGSGTIALTCVMASGNDACTGATAIGEGSFPFSTIGATTDGPSPCAGLGNDIWFNYTATCNANVQVSTCGSGYDTVVAAYAGCGCPVGAPLACNDDSCGLQSNILFAVTSGQCYKIQLGGFFSATGTGTLTLTCIMPPGNDNCDQATSISDGTTAFSNIGAVTDGPAHPVQCNFFGEPQISQDIWYNYNATSTGAIQVSLCGSTYDTEVAVYSGCGCPVSDANLVCCNDDSCGLQSNLQFNSTSGTCYKIRVGGFGAATGTGTITIGAAPPPPPPPCELPCPMGGITEPTPAMGSCGGSPACALGPADTVNGGCNVTPNAFTAISCGQTICGTGGNDGAFRDTDWYQVTVAESTALTWTATSQFIANLLILDGNCPTTILATTLGIPACSSGSVTLCVNPGTYRVFISTDDFAGDPCPLLYNATLTCAPCMPPPLPPNDNCANPIAVSEGTTAFDTTMATTDGLDHVSCYFGFTSNTNKDLWYSYTPSCSGDVTVSLCLGATPYDSKIVAYNGCSAAACPPTDADLLQCDDDGCAFAGYSVIPGQNPALFSVVAGNCYRIRVGGFGAASGAGTMTITNSNFPCAPPTTIASANPPHASANGGVPFEDVLQNTDTALVQQGIGRAGTPSEGPVTYAPISVTFASTPAPAPSMANITVVCTDLAGNGNGDCPTVSSVAGSGVGPYLLTMSAGIPVRECTTFTFAGTQAGQKLQYRNLPGDVNLNSTTTGQDVITLVSAINLNMSALPRHDLNRNGGVTGQDVIRLVQLINGGLTVSPNTGFNAATLAACP